MLGSAPFWRRRHCKLEYNEYSNHYSIWKLCVLNTSSSVDEVCLLYYRSGTEASPFRELQQFIFEFDDFFAAARTIRGRRDE